MQNASPSSGVVLRDFDFPEVIIFYVFSFNPWRPKVFLTTSNLVAEISQRGFFPIFYAFDA